MPNNAASRELSSDVYAPGEFITPAKERFLDLAQRYDLIPLCLRLSGDDETPLTVWRKIGADSLLETVESEGGPGRYSLLGRGQTLSFTLKGRSVEIQRGQETPVREDCVDNPLLRVRETLAGLRVYQAGGVPSVFLSLIGFLGYEAAAWFEALPLHPRQGGIPDARLVLPEILVGCDAFDRALWLICFVLPGDKPSQAYSLGVERIRQVMQQLDCPAEKRPKSGEQGGRARLRPGAGREEYIRCVRAVQDHIRAGDIIQSVIAQHLEVDEPPDPMTVYRRLRTQNPSPYHFYLKYGDHALVGASPELLVKLSEGRLTIRPIAGTRPRGIDPKADLELEEELVKDEKEKAEHLMLVDLARNDIGRVAVSGSVLVSDFMKVERYSHVMHLVSTVEGRLRRGKNAFDVIAATFPAGTLTGAPKLRAMEIIHEQEGRARGPYGGAVLRLGLCGDFDSCITIRTVVFEGGRAFVSAGAGIVNQSQPESEFAECMSKAAAALKALGITSEKEGEMPGEERKNGTDY